MKIRMNPASPKYSYVQTDHGQMHLRIWGDQKGINIVCLHPMPYSGSYYDTFCQQLVSSTAYSAVALDFIGYGRSAMIDSPISIKEHAQASAACLEELISSGIISDDISLMGFHTGSAVANEIAIVYPEIVRQVIFVTYPYFEKSQRAELLRTLNKDSIGKDLNSLQESWDFTISKRPQGIPFNRAFSNFIEQLQNADRNWFGFDSMFNYPSEKRLPLIEHPVLVINDNSSLTEATIQANEMIKNSVYEELTDAQGGVFELNVDQIIKHVCTFLQSQCN